MSPPNDEGPSASTEAVEASAEITPTEASTTDKSLSEELLGVIDKLHNGVELSQEDRKLLSRAKFSPGTQDFLSRAMLMGAYPTPYLRSEYKLAFKRIVGEAMALAIRGDLQTAPECLASAEKLLANAEKFLADRTGEEARMWYVQATVMLLVLLLSLFALLNLYPVPPKTNADIAATKGEPTVTEQTIQESSPYKLGLYLLAIVGGSLGAGFSLLLRIGKERIDPATVRRSVYGEVLFRLTIGALAALIILFGMEADVFGGFLKVSSENGLINAALYARTFWIIGVFSIAAGACESFVPSLLNQLSDSTIDTTGDKLAAESSNGKKETPPASAPEAQSDS